MKVFCGRSTLPPNKIRPQINFVKCSMVLRLYVIGFSSYMVKWKVVLFQPCLCGVAYIQAVQDIRMVSTYICIRCLESSSYRSCRLSRVNLCIRIYAYNKSFNEIEFNIENKTQVTSGAQDYLLFTSSWSTYCTSY